MSTPRTHPTATRRLCVYLPACLGVVVLATSLAFAIVPDDPGHELGPIQLSGGGALAAAGLGMIHRLRRDGLRHRLAPLWVTAAAGASFLAWREIELDMHLFQLHAFSWKYLDDGNRPLAHRLIFGALSLGSIAAMAGYLYLHWNRFVTGLRQRWPPLLVALGGGGVLTLVLSQLWDKGELIHRNLAIAAFRSARLEPLPEEVLELIGALLLLSCVIELNVLARRGHPALVEIPSEQLPGPPSGTRR